MKELSAIPPPVAAIVQRQKKDWNQLVGEISRLAEQDDQNALEMGDRLLAIEAAWGKAHVKTAAEQAGVNWSVARQRCWVSRRVPKGHPLRALPLTFCHLRTLATTDDPEQWAQQVVEHQWSVATLREKIERAGDQKAQIDGDPCIQCERSLAGAKEIVSFIIGGAKRARCCSLPCAVAYFQELVQDAGDPLG